MNCLRDTTQYYFCYFQEPEPGEFELVVCNLDDLRDLVKRFADPELIIEKKGKKEKVGKGKCLELGVCLSRV